LVKETDKVTVPGPFKGLGKRIGVGITTTVVVWVTFGVNVPETVKVGVKVGVVLGVMVEFGVTVPEGEAVGVEV
jgi:hypothetical protein